jgi:uncharacterized protein (UPF0371 family)
MVGFDKEAYYSLQKKAIEDRIAKFPNGRLYLEVGGKLLYDGHAERVLPGFDPEVKLKLFREFKDQLELIYCVNAGDIENNRLLKDDIESYHDVVFQMIAAFEEKLEIRPIIAINMINRHAPQSYLREFLDEAHERGYKLYKRYLIDGYPEGTDLVISDQGYGADEYIPVTKNLIVVTGAASNSGKLSTCLGQLYLDKKHGFDSGYAKYELFPIWNLPLRHPVNLAYEAATADIGDYNVEDQYHKKAYGITSINYNRDVEAFEIVKAIGHKIVSPDNFIATYQSPTDMGINTAGFCIIDDGIVQKAGMQEIRHRREVFQKLVNLGLGKEAWVETCDTLLRAESHT